jgi:TolB-like protein
LVSGAPRLAVLPFDDLSAQGDMRFFADGISEEILLAVARGAEVATIGKHSSFAFRGADKARSAKALAATHILDGSVRRASGRVRIVVHLLDAASEEIAWSEVYERALEDLLEIQIDIARMVASKLELDFRAAPSPEIAPATYDLYLRAKGLDYSPGNLEMQLALLERVTKTAPRFAPGWGGLASVLSEYRYERPMGEWPAIAAQGRDAIAHAVAIDPREPNALIAEFQLLDVFGSFERQAEILGLLRQEIHQTSAYHYLQGQHLAAIGQMAGAVSANAIVRSLDRGHPYYDGAYGYYLFYAGRNEEARDEMLAELQTAPGNHYVAATLMSCAAALGDRPLLEMLSDADRLKRFPLGTLAPVVRIAHLEIDDDPAARRKFGTSILERFSRSGRFDLVSAVYAARNCSPAACHDIIDGLPIAPALEDPIASDFISNWPTVLFIKGLGEIRRDRRFARLCARLGLAQFWVRNDRWPDCADAEPLDYDFRLAVREAAEAVRVDPPFDGRG